MTTITGKLGQLAHQNGDTIGVIHDRAANYMRFIRIPAEVVEHLDPGVLTTEEPVTLTGHLCDHGQYFLVTSGHV